MSPSLNLYTGQIEKENIIKSNKKMVIQKEQMDYILLAPTTDLVCRGK